MVWRGWNCEVWSGGWNCEFWRGAGIVKSGVRKEPKPGTEEVEPKSVS